MGVADSTRRRGLATQAATTVFQGLCVAASTPPTLPPTKRASDRIGLARIHAVHGTRSASILCAGMLTFNFGHHHNRNTNSLALLGLHLEAASTLVDHHKAAPAGVVGSESFGQEATAPSTNEDVCPYNLSRVPGTTLRSDRERHHSGISFRAVSWELR